MAQPETGTSTTELTLAQCDALLSGAVKPCPGCKVRAMVSTLKTEPDAHNMIQLCPACHGTGEVPCWPMLRETCPCLLVDYAKLRMKITHHPNSFKECPACHREGSHSDKCLFCPNGLGYLPAVDQGKLEAVLLSERWTVSMTSATDEASKTHVWAKMMHDDHLDKLGHSDPLPDNPDIEDYRVAARLATARAAVGALGLKSEVSE